MNTLASWDMDSRKTLTAGVRLEKGFLGDRVRRNQEDLDREIEGIILEISAAENTAEFTQLYQDTSDELRRLLVRKMGNKEEAEEIAQDAYLKLCRLKHNRDIGNLRSYLFNMAVRLAINVLRKR